MIASYAVAHGLAATSLRYFNVAGAHGRFGERHAVETHLIPLVLQVASGERESMQIFGDDWPTPDGTCIRDYIHVDDLADAHLLALAHAVPGEHAIYNLGSGTGFSVREVVEACRAVTGHPIPTVVAPRRGGDPAVLVASSEAATAALGWQPETHGPADDRRRRLALHPAAPRRLIQPQPGPRWGRAGCRPADVHLDGLRPRRRPPADLRRVGRRSRPSHRRRLRRRVGPGARRRRSSCGTRAAAGRDAARVRRSGRPAARSGGCPPPQTAQRRREAVTGPRGLGPVQRDLASAPSPRSSAHSASSAAGSAASGSGVSRASAAHSASAAAGRDPVQAATAASRTTGSAAPGRAPPPARRRASRRPRQPDAPPGAPPPSEPARVGAGSAASTRRGPPPTPPAPRRVRRRARRSPR